MSVMMVTTDGNFVAIVDHGSHVDILLSSVALLEPSVVRLKTRPDFDVLLAQIKENRAKRERLWAER